MKMLVKDKVNFLLAFAPVAVGLVLYYFLGSWIYESAMTQGSALIDSYVTKDSLGSVLYWLAAAILTVMLFFLVNWTFVLVVTLIASPFNDLLSLRIENHLKGKTNLELAPSFAGLLPKIIYIALNEFKKIALIVLFTVLSLIFGYIPFLAPIAIFIAVMLLASEFLDYSWSRHDIEFKKCFQDLRRNTVGYGVGGGIFFMIVSVPLINLIVPSLATSYFTMLWVNLNENRNKITG